MTLMEIGEMFTQSTSSLLIGVFILLTLIEITPIKINPWGTILKRMGKALNAEVAEKITTLDKNTAERDVNFNNRMNTIEGKLDAHIEESEEREIRTRRESILDFASAIANGRNYTKEQYEQMLSECDSYESYCDRKKIPNSVAEASIKIIQDNYKKHLEGNDFLATKFSAQKDDVK